MALASPRTITGSELLAAAFRDLHAVRLHGFALLVALGDRQAAGRAAAEALAAGAREARNLRHPERAAAWLRARVVAQLRRLRPGSGSVEREGQAVLAELGVDALAYRGLAGLSPIRRAAVAAAIIEGFEPIDVETILGVSPSHARQMVAIGLSRFLSSVTPLGRDPTIGTGPLARRVRDAAGRALTPIGSDAP